MATEKEYLDREGVEVLWSRIHDFFPRLSESGKVPQQYLPGYVDDVIELNKRLKTSIDNTTDLDENLIESLDPARYKNDIVYAGANEKETDRTVTLFYHQGLGIFYLGVAAYIEFTENEETKERCVESTYFKWDEIKKGDALLYPACEEYGIDVNTSITNGTVTIKSAITASPLLIYYRTETSSYVTILEDDESRQMIAYPFESGKIYVDAEANKSYRWSGSQLVEIGGGVALGETAETAFRGDHGAWIYNSIMQGNPAVVTPVITISWTYYENTDTSDATPVTPEKNAGTATSPQIEIGYRAKYTATWKWTATSGKKNPTETSGTFGTTLPSSGVASASKTTTVTATTTISQTVTAPKQGLVVSNNAVVAPSGIDSASASHKITFLYKRYWGVTTASSITESVIEGLENSELTSTKSKTLTGVTASSTQYYVIAYPTALGELSSIIQDGATPVLSAFTRTTVSVTNAAGYTQDYYVYRSNNVGAFTSAKLALS